MPSQLSERVRILLYSAALFCFYNFTQTIAGSLICCYSLSAWKVHEVGNCKKKKLCSLIFWLHGSCSVKVLSFWKSRSNIKISRAFKVFGSTCFIKVQIKKVSTKTMLKKMSCSPTSEFYSVLTEKNLSAAWKEKNIGREADKYQWLLQSHLAQNSVLIVRLSSHWRQSQMLVGLRVCLLFSIHICAYTIHTFALGFTWIDGF